ncbi:type VII toxin-antitoxin system HepT family RNase toxin [Aliagarivorans marinus]|uniref:type VII toxin-antitoxin system HepT family RNase toxin n=1 Tax=Aliagarivorans marinus TaxID=561965 RepID=UPI00040919CC|nr:DUF86 domain-containing protein [Aliagarivorans marinus]
MNDVIVNKIATIERCLERIRSVYQEAGEHFAEDFTRQDSVVLNLQRACEACIDLANIVNKQQRNGIPQNSRDSFALLGQVGVLDTALSDNLQKMVGLRNIAVHDYQTLNLAIVQHVVENRLGDFHSFCLALKAVDLTSD